ncbi:SAC3/GANP/Nin1/mts3/eIF-3 p25 family-domain-containing protein [Dichotomocladium elegans]|nr:SAC3/GANP/Nin1/mts3/eIF-3 p25 family-domain-containing protein [Dichotomocladium elegans]
MRATSWPPSLQEYVEEVFNSCPPERRDQAEAELRNLILEKHRAGTLMTIDWQEVDLPRKRKELLSSAPPTFEEQEKRKNRLKRFQQQGEQSPRKPAISSSLVRAEYKHRNEFGLMPMSISNQKAVDIVGTCELLEKNYLRLTAAPDPATVRPLHILKQTLELLKRKWKAEQNYTYICDQFKSMRQDLTVQRIRNEFTVTVYEIHARIALERGDLGEYNQCQTQLKQLYKMGIPGHVMEFTAYRILYFLHTRNWSDINQVMAELTPKQQEDETVQHALKVRSSLATSNFHQFFKLYLSAPNMGGYLMDQFVERERVQALMILCKAFRPTLSVDFITNELAFEDRPQLEKFLEEHNASHITGDSLNTKLAFANLNESYKKYKKIDIKGQL